MSDHPSTYGFADPPPPKRRHVPRPKLRYEGDDPLPDRPPDPWWAFDWFLPVLLAAVAVWVGLGIPAMKWPWVGLVLVAAGLFIVAVGQIYLFLLIREQDGWEQSLLVFLFGWHRFLYLHLNPDVALRPNVISGCGVLMAFTGIGLFLLGTRPKP